MLNRDLDQLKTDPHARERCISIMLPVKDALEVLYGRWKLPIIISLTFGPKRFKEIVKEVGITDKVLAKELKDMEAHRLITRTEISTFPLTVEYAITPHGESLHGLIGSLAEWGIAHRKKILEQ
jgi:DNA-binding HxlR family transcriptional regulator